MALANGPYTKNALHIFSLEKSWDLASLKRSCFYLSFSSILSIAPSAVIVFRNGKSDCKGS